MWFVVVRCAFSLPCSPALRWARSPFAGSAFANAVQPYGTNDAGGFRNVLPPGENGLDNLPQVLEYKSSKSIPKHFDDQQPLYENLLYGAPTLTDETDPELLQGRHLRRRAGRTRIDDRTETGGDDRARQGLRNPAHLRRNARRHDVRRGLRRRRRPPLPDGRAAPHRPRRTRPPSSAARTPPPTRASGRFAPYTEADLEEQIHEMETEHGAPGKQAVEDLDNYVEGINAYIAAANLDPKLKPAEYSLHQQADGTVETDRHHRDRLAGRRHLRQGRRQRAALGADDGGDGRTDGREGRAARPGKASARRTTRKRRRRSTKPFPYETESAFAKRGLALPEPKSVYEPPIAERLRGRRQGHAPA